MKKDFLVFIIILLVIFVICIFLPEKIPIHFNAQGTPDLLVNRFFLLFGAIIPYSAYWRYLRDKDKE